MTGQIEKPTKELPVFTLKQVSEHNAETDCWVAINNRVFNITNWLAKHPGGKSILFNFAGTDCSDEFRIFHYTPNYKLLKSFCVGTLHPDDCRKNTELSKDLQELHDRIKLQGAFLPDYWFYVSRAAIILALFAASAYLFNYSSSLWVCAASAICLGMAWQQLAFVGHDIGHHVLSHNRNTDDNLGVVFGNFLQGISLEWWKHSHNTHHSVTNSVTHDPDIQHLPFLAVNKAFFKSIFSKYYFRTLDFDKVCEFFIAKQHYLFYVVMALARFNLYAQSFRHNIVGAGSTNVRKNIELVSLAGFWVWFLTVLSFTQTWWHLAVFLLVSHAVAGIVHVQICINHFPMDVYEGLPQKAFTDDSYLMSQLMTTRDIECPPFMDFFHGGLQFQVEHHVFPHLTRSHLRNVRDELQVICKKHDLPYQSVGFWRANWDVIVKLYETSKQMKLADMFLDGINLNG